VDELEKIQVVNKHGNKFGCDEVVRYLRNGLAHLNIIVEPSDGSEGEITKVIIYAKEQTACNNDPCANPKCLKLKQGCIDPNIDIKSICTFTFPIKPDNELRKFVDFFVKHALQCLGDEICTDCRYKKSTSQTHS
jgi:hypothetical protein